MCPPCGKFNRRPVRRGRFVLKRLYLLRHAKSSWDDPTLDDFDRPLAPRGRQAAPLIAEHISSLGIRPDVVLCSPALRARQTLDRVTRMLDGIPPTYDDRVYTFNGGDLLGRLREIGDGTEAVLVVGHNPALHELAVSLTGQQDATASPQLAHLREKFPTAAFAALDCAVDHWAELGAGTCTLDHFTRPKDLKR